MSLAHRSLVVAAIKSREAYEMVAVSGEGERMDGDLGELWQTIVEFYTRDAGAERAAADLLLAQWTVKDRNQKRVERRTALMADLVDSPASLANVREALMLAERARVGLLLAGALVGDQPDAAVTELIEAYQGIDERYAVEQDDAMDWLGIIKRRAKPEGAIPVTPKALNARLNGGLRPGHNVVIYARPECGKTAFAITMAVGFAKRGIRVLYTGNEDPIEDIALRALSCITGRTADELAQDPDGAQLEAVQRGVGNMVFAGLSPGTLVELERLVRIHKPVVLVVDQLRNLTGAKSENFTQLLDRSAQGVRAIGKRHGLITIAVTQAGDSARGKAVLHDGDIDSSNTGIPGAADLLIGIGVNETLELAGQRMISLAKNKLSGIHDHFPVNIDPTKSRFTSA